VRRLIVQAHIPARDAQLTRDPRPSADVSGVPGRARVTVSRGMLARWSVPQIRAHLAHLASHYRHGDQLTLALVMALLALAGFGEAVLYTHSPLAQRLRQAMAWKAAHSSNVSAPPRSN